MRFTIIPDSGPVVGGGHLSRTVALAQAIRTETRINPVFVTKDKRAAQWINKYDFRTTPSRAAFSDVIITDSYRITNTDLRRLASSCRSLICIDDLGRLTGPCAWVINSSPGAHFMDYSSRKALGFLLGHRFHPLRREFLVEPRKKFRPRQVKNVLVSLGRTSIERSLLRLVFMMRRWQPHIVFHVLASGSKISHPLSDMPNVQCYRSPASIRLLMEKCDLAVSAGGQTLFELLYLGIPTIAIRLADNQVNNIKGFQALGALNDAGPLHDKEFPNRLKKHFFNLCENINARRALSRAGKTNMDALGGKRLAGIIKREI